MSASGVFPKMLGEHRLEVLDLSVQCRDDMDCCSRGGPERCSYRGGRGEVLAAQDGLDLAGACLDIALSSSRFEC